MTNGTARDPAADDDARDLRPALESLLAAYGPILAEDLAERASTVRLVSAPARSVPAILPAATFSARSLRSTCEPSIRCAVRLCLTQFRRDSPSREASAVSTLSTCMHRTGRSRRADRTMAQTSGRSRYEMI
jgi:hypothetical protein